MREREYLDWLANQPDPVRDDVERDDSWATFMSQRRKLKESERWKQRRVEQWAARGRKAPAESHLQRVELDFKAWCERRGQQLVDNMAADPSVARWARTTFDRERVRERQRADYAAKVAALGKPVGEYARARSDAKQQKQQQREECKVERATVHRQEQERLAKQRERLERQLPCCQ